MGQINYVCSPTSFLPLVSSRHVYLLCHTFQQNEAVLRLHEKTNNFKASRRSTVSRTFLLVPLASTDLSSHPYVALLGTVMVGPDPPSCPQILWQSSRSKICIRNLACSSEIFSL